MTKDQFAAANFARISEAGELGSNPACHDHLDKKSVPVGLAFVYVVAETGLPARGLAFLRVDD